MNGRAGRLVAEFVLIVVGVLVAFAVENWRQSRSDDTRERLLLEGIAADLQRDTSDLERSIAFAQARMVATDDLLRLIGDPDTATLSGAPPENLPTGLTAGNWNVLLSEARAVYPPGFRTAQQALFIAGAEIGFGVSDATYAEARDNGRMELIEDAELRSAIATHYYLAIQMASGIQNVRFGWAIPHLVSDLQEAGLTPAGGASDAQVATILSSQPSVVAGLKNVRYEAGYLTSMYQHRLNEASAMLDRVTAAIVSMGPT